MKVEQGGLTRPQQRPQTSKRPEGMPRNMALAEPIGMSFSGALGYNTNSRPIVNEDLGPVQTSGQKPKASDNV